MPQFDELFIHLGAALAIGLLIGLERGWKARDADEGERVAGVRTYGLIGLLGGVTGVLGERLGAIAWGFAFAALAGVLVTAYVVNRRVHDDAGITSLVAGLLTFGFGSLAVLGQLQAAAAFAVLTAMLLGFKPLLHRWVKALEPDELRAMLQLLLISVVLLPVLPDRGYGPWQALNPYEIWWMVVLIASISFAGYFSIKVAGARRGTLFTGLFAGLASSTALTLHFARTARGHPALAPELATGVLLACGTMLPRMVLVAGVLDRALVLPLLVPALIMALAVYGPALYSWRRGAMRGTDTRAPLGNPLELRTALGFGLLLAGVMLLVQALKAWAGDAGILALAAVSGIADVDPITLSLARLSGETLTTDVAARGIVLAAAVNNLVKGGMAGVIGGRAMALRAGVPLALSALVGLAAVFMSVPSGLSAS